MKLKFDPNQSYQLQAVKAVTDIFEGQPLKAGDFEFSFTEKALQFQQSGVGNVITLKENQILENVRRSQQENGLPLSDKLDGMNFSVEMETGTGKTYVYLRTVYELNRIYGFKKFVIVVPSIAIREGVLKNLEITHEHFQTLYDRVPANFSVYNAQNVSRLRSFSSNNTIQILVINIDSFAKDENIINKPNDKLTGKKPIEFIRYTRPIVIVDEPQNMETDIRRKAVENLHPCCTLRYSATHTNLYNLVYSLDPVKAYDLGLVKQIEVDSVISEDSTNDAFIRLEKVAATKTKTSAKITLDYNDKKGVKKKTVTARVEDDLYNLSSNREIYRDGFIIEEIDVAGRTVTFTNGLTLTVGQASGGMTQEIMKYQLEKTVEEHLRKELALSDKGIKVLSLIFIDRVANYREYDEAGNPRPGKLAGWFEEIYNRLAAKPAFKALELHPADKVHNGYFAQDKNGRYKDSSESRETKADDDTYTLIMQAKERLLDQDEPLRFIFSHSALREGWDNPNVFQICTINETKSELKKRQEIGRGLRLPVNQDGERSFDKNINRLTVIANESYRDFAKNLQNEIEEDCGVSFGGRIRDKRKRVKVKYRKGFTLDLRFKDIWSRIKHRTSYRVEYSSTELIDAASKAIKEMPPVKRPSLRMERVQLQIDGDGVAGRIVSSGAQRLDTSHFKMPDIIGYIQKKTELTRHTIHDILCGSGRLDDVLENPQLFLDMAVREISRVLHALMIDGVKYLKLGGKEYEMRLFDRDDLDIYSDTLAFKVGDADKTIYQNFIPLDSSIEEDFARECETREDVEFYFKLPRWFTIPTPIGSYNPDWALIFNDEKKIYFVTETKGSTDPEQLRHTEALKIKCGKAHFKECEDIEFRQAVSVNDLL